jgi:nicotinamide mononucleotide transporter
MLKKSFFIVSCPSFPDSWEKALYFPSRRGAREGCGVDRAIFTVGGYAMSPLEFWGTLLYLWSVWLVGRGSVWTWPVGNVAVVLYALLFWRIRLYADLAEQVYFFAAGFYGWWAWLRRGRGRAGEAAAPVGYGTRRGNAATCAVLAGACVLGTLALRRVHLWLPLWFPEPASYPLLDATTTVASFVAMILMAWRRVENWYLWIFVDVVDVWLYAAKEVWLLSAVYVLFLALAIKGLRHWRRLAAAGGAPAGLPA